MVMVRVVGVKRYKDRHGTPRAYWRRKGVPAVAIDPDLEGAELAALIAKLEKTHLGPVKAKAGTLRLLVGDYREKSDHWRSLRPRTRKDYERVFTWLGGALDVALVEFTPAEMAQLRDKARDLHGAKFANQVLTTLKFVFRHGVEQGDLRTNPVLGLGRATAAAVDADGVEIVTASGTGNRPCTPAEAVTILDHAPPKLQTAIAIALYASLREGDTVALLRSARAGDWLTALQSKTRRAGKPARPVTIYVGDDFGAYLDAAPKTPAVTICTKEDGTPWTLEGFKTAWGRYRDDLLKRELIGAGVTFHGLRHTAPTILEDAGFDESQTKHQLGHGPKTVSGHYGMTAERRKLLKDMALCVEQVLRDARGNVVGIGNTSVYPPQQVSTPPRR
jgi:integrase